MDVTLDAPIDLLPTGSMYAREGFDYGSLRIFIAGYQGWMSIRLTPDGAYRLRLSPASGKVTYTILAGHSDTVRSIAATMLRGAARADGFEVSP